MPTDRAGWDTRTKIIRPTVTDTFRGALVSFSRDIVRQAVTRCGFALRQVEDDHVVDQLSLRAEILCKPFSQPGAVIVVCRFEVIDACTVAGNGQSLDLRLQL